MRLDHDETRQFLICAPGFAQGLGGDGPPPIPKAGGSWWRSMMGRSQRTHSRKRKMRKPSERYQNLRPAFQPLPLPRTDIVTIEADDDPWIPARDARCRARPGQTPVCALRFLVRRDFPVMCTDPDALYRPASNR